MAWQEIRRYIKGRRQFINDYLDRRKINDPLLKERIKIFDRGAGNYTWPAPTSEIVERNTLFQTEKSNLESILTQAITLRVIWTHNAEKAEVVLLNQLFLEGAPGR